MGGFPEGIRFANPPMTTHTRLISPLSTYAPIQMNGRTLVLVTGASRGFGRCVSEEFVRKVAPVNPITLVLIARSHAGLENAASAIEEVARGIPTASDVVVQQEALDLGDMDRLEGRLDDILAEIGEDFVLLVASRRMPAENRKA